MYKYSEYKPSNILILNWEDQLKHNGDVGEQISKCSQKWKNMAPCQPHRWLSEHVNNNLILLDLIKDPPVQIDNLDHI